MRLRYCNAHESGAEALPAKTPKQLKKEAEKAAKLEKILAKKEKLTETEASEKIKNEVPSKRSSAPKAAETESKGNLYIFPKKNKKYEQELFFVFNSYTTSAG